MTAASSIPVQAAIERSMREFGIREQRWECIVLFTADGLVMASSGESLLYPPDTLLEFSIALLETVRLLDSKRPFHEITVSAAENRTLVFRYFDAWSERMILAAVVTGRKGFKRALSRLINRIAGIE